MSKKPPDPAPPPKRSGEDRAFRDLLKKLVAVPKKEIDELMAQRKRRKRRK